MPNRPMTFTPGVSEDASGQPFYDLDNGSIEVGRSGGTTETPLYEDQITGEREYQITEEDLAQDLEYQGDLTEEYLDAVIEVYPEIYDALEWAVEALDPAFIEDYNNALDSGDIEDFMPMIEQMMQDYFDEHPELEEQLEEDAPIDQQEIDSSIDAMMKTEPGGTEAAMDWMQYAVDTQNSDPVLSQAAELTAAFHRQEISSSEAIQQMMQRHSMKDLQRVFRTLWASSDESAQDVLDEYPEQLIE